MKNPFNKDVSSSSAVVQGSQIANQGTKSEETYRQEAVAGISESYPDTTAMPTFGQRIQQSAADNFDYNVNYLLSVRGVLNISQLVLSMLVCSLLASTCRHTLSQGSGFTGFYCKSSDTYAFVIGCSAFILSAIHMGCCFFSTRTAEEIYTTVFELTYYVVYSILYLTSSLNLLSHVYSRNSGRYEYEFGYGKIVGGSILGLMACVTYAMSAIWFLVYHKMKQRSSSRQVQSFS